uniref:Uncharacterized protein n=1 Tax=Oryza punctata TaxID=4537 RepID=A0A0E0MJP7_ORYPU
MTVHHDSAQMVGSDNKHGGCAITHVLIAHPSRYKQISQSRYNHVEATVYVAYSHISQAQAKNLN